MICVLLISDVRVNREALASLIAQDDRVDVTAHIAFADALHRADGSPDVVVVDTSHNDGPEAARSVMSWSKAPIVALAAPKDEAQVIALAEMGVIGFVEADADLDELVTGIANAARNQPTLSPRIASALLRRLSSLARPTEAEISVLTMRERQVVDLIAENLTNKEIAEQLCIEVATVKNHVHNILEKLQVSRRSEIVTRLRLVRPDTSSGKTLRVAIAGSTNSP